MGDSLGYEYDPEEDLFESFIDEFLSVFSHMGYGEYVVSWVGPPKGLTGETQQGCSTFTIESRGDVRQFLDNTVQGKTDGSRLEIEYYEESVEEPEIKLTIYGGASYWFVPADRK